MEYRFGLNISYRIGNSHLFYDIHIVLIRCYSLFYDVVPYFLFYKLSSILRCMKRKTTS